MGALRTSEEGGDVLGGEAKQLRSDDDRRIDAPGQIIIDSGPVISVPAAAPRPAAARSSSMPVAPQKSSGLGLVLVVYVLAAAALAAAAYERFLM